MVEFLKQSVERLEPPACPNCNLEMTWYRSFRPMNAADPELIMHYFKCPNCSRLGEVATRIGVPGNGGDPPLLSAPAVAFRCLPIRALRGRARQLERSSR